MTSFRRISDMAVVQREREREEAGGGGGGPWGGMERQESRGRRCRK